MPKNSLPNHLRPLLFQILDPPLLTIEDVIIGTLKMISATAKVILATEEVITATLKTISATTKVILAAKN